MQTPEPSATLAVQHRSSMKWGIQAWLAHWRPQSAAQTSSHCWWWGTGEQWWPAQLAPWGTWLACGRRHDASSSTPIPIGDYTRGEDGAIPALTSPTAATHPCQPTSGVAHSPVNNISLENLCTAARLKATTHLGLTHCRAYSVLLEQLCLHHSWREMTSLVAQRKQEG